MGGEDKTLDTGCTLKVTITSVYKIAKGSSILNL